MALGLQTMAPASQRNGVGFGGCCGRISARVCAVDAEAMTRGRCVMLPVIFWTV